MKERYVAFISYAHRDERWALWLQKALETYRIPRKITAQSSNLQLGGKALFPVFLDRSELPSSSDLSLSIRSALDDSGALIVICSPAARKSRWVKEEIKHFQQSGKGSRIFCLLVDGSTDTDSVDCAFPEPLLVDPDGISKVEPLAADPRKKADGKRAARLKIAAGLLGVGVDALMQRDAQRRLRNRGIMTVASMVIAAGMLAFAIAAQLAREEAELRREQAESLIDFMLVSLREQLEPIGKLDILDEVGDQAMDYFQALGDMGSPQERLSRVLALRQIGEVRFRQGRLDQANLAFLESRDLAKALVTDVPGVVGHIFELGQAEFWVGYAALERADLETAQDSSEQYLEHSLKLLDMDPTSTDFKTEVLYAYSNLGTLAKLQGDSVAALKFFQNALSENIALLELEPGSINLQVDLGNGYSWIGAAELQLNQLKRSERAYQKAVETLSNVYRQDDSPLNAENLAQNHYHLGNVLALRGNIDAAGDSYLQSAELLEGLVQHDPENAIWRCDQAIANYHWAELGMSTGSDIASATLLERARVNFSELLDENSGDLRSIEYLALTERTLWKLHGDANSLEAAQYRILDLLDSQTDIIPRTALHVALVAESYGLLLYGRGDISQAKNTWRRALAILQSTVGVGPSHLAMQASLMVHLGQSDQAAIILEKLESSGYRDPRHIPHLL